MREFEISIVLSGTGTEKNLELAVKEMLSRAVRCTPDGRFDWSAASVSVSVYTENPKRTT